MNQQLKKTTIPGCEKHKEANEHMIIISPDDYIERRAYIHMILMTEPDTETALNMIQQYDIDHFYVNTSAWEAIGQIEF